MTNLYIYKFIYKLIYDKYIIIYDKYIIIYCIICKFKGERQILLMRLRVILRINLEYFLLYPT